MSKKLKLTILTNTIDIEKEKVKTPDIMRRSDQVNYPSPLNSPTSIKHRETTERIIDIQDLLRGIYKKNIYKEKNYEEKFEKKFYNYNNLSIAALQAACSAFFFILCLLELKNMTKPQSYFSSLCDHIVFNTSNAFVDPVLYFSID